MTITASASNDSFDGGDNTDPKSIKLPIDTEEKNTILLNVETAVKDLVSKLAKKEEVSGVGYDIALEDYTHLPNSLTGVVVHYLIQGLKFDFNMEFNETPVCLRVRSSDGLDKKVAGKKRLLTKDQKNELLAKTNMNYYENDISKGTLSLEDAFASIKAAFEKKQEFEGMGYMLPSKKTATPYWKDED